MSIDRIPARYLVRVSRGVLVADAISQHRDRTGHGGGCVLVFDAPARQFRCSVPLVEHEGAPG